MWSSDLARKLLDLLELGRKNMAPPGSLGTAAQAEEPSTGSDVQVRKTHWGNRQVYFEAKYKTKITSLDKISNRK